MANFSGQITLDSGNVTNTTIAAGAAIETSKLKHRYLVGCDFGLAIGDTPAAAERIVHVARSSGTLQAFAALLNDTGTSTNVNFDLKVNGSTVLSATVNVTNSQSDREAVAGTVTSANLVAGDVVSISLAVTSTTGAQGPFAQVTIDENPA